MLADVDAVDEDRSAGRVVEARDEVDERRLAAAGAADDRRRLARAGAERDVAEDRLLGARVAELDVAELDDAALGGIGRARRAAPGRGSSGSVSRTSRIRPDDTAARGMRMNMNTAVRTANRICEQVLQERGQVADLTARPSSTRMAPNHMTATVERLRIAVIDRDREREQRG